MSTAVCVQAAVREGVGPALQAALAAADAEVSTGCSPLATLPGVHFARWLTIPGDASLPGGAIVESLVYTADVDGSVAGHLRELDRRAGSLLDQLFGHCVGYPTSPSDRPQWLREHRVASAASYVNTVGLTVARIGAEARLSDWLQRRLDEQRTELLSLRAGEIHRRLRADLAANPAMAYALEPAADERWTARARRWTTLATAVLLVLVLLPLLIVVAIPWLLALRRLERSDPSSVERPDRARVERLRSREDAFAHNPFGALGVVKAGRLRASTVKIVLLGISVAASCVFIRGSLAGVTTIHVARWVPLDGGRRMIFTSCYDGSLESYMNDFIDKLSWGLNVIFSNGVGYPRTRWLIFGGAKDEQTFKDYLRCHQLETSVSYAAHPTLTMANIRANVAIRRGLSTPLDDARAAEWLALL
ncbi:MAG TPA: hypothetical protein VIT41_14015 [Microlunatus sp.]